jgi:hypothetical protein
VKNSDEKQESLQIPTQINPNLKPTPTLTIKPQSPTPTPSPTPPIKNTITNKLPIYKLSPNST